MLRLFIVCELKKKMAATPIILQVSVTCYLTSKLQHFCEGSRAYLKYTMKLHKLKNDYISG